jgi:hypothetical protein
MCETSRLAELANRIQDDSGIDVALQQMLCYLYLGPADILLIATQSGNIAQHL